jgi:predicted O-methyltransferase YrrM
MYLPWPVRPILNYSKNQRILRHGLKEVRACSDAMGPVKDALARALRWPSRDERRAWAAIDQRWKDLSKRTDPIRLVGASVPPNVVGRSVPVGEHTMNTSTTRPWGDFLFQLVRVIQPQAALELGTCVGLSASYIAAAMQINNRGHLWTLEGIADSAKIARETFSVLGLSDRVTTIVGRFIDTLDTALKNGPYTFAFVDGHHEGDATIEYFNKIKPHLSGNSILVFDDINWSRGMQNAWKEITRDKDVRDHVNVLDWGVLAIYS